MSVVPEWLVCDGVTSLRGRGVVLAGRIFIDGENVSHARLAARIRQLGGRVVPAHRSYGVDILVLGDPSGTRVSDPLREYSQQVLDIERQMVLTGKHVHVIREDGLEALLYRRAARCRRLQLPTWREPSPRAA